MFFFDSTRSERMAEKRQMVIIARRRVKQVSRRSPRQANTPTYLPTTMIWTTATRTALFQLPYFEATRITSIEEWAKSPTSKLLSFALGHGTRPHIPCSLGWAVTTMASVPAHHGARMSDVRLAEWTKRKNRVATTSLVRDSNQSSNSAV